MMSTLGELASSSDLRGLRDYLCSLDVAAIVDELGRWNRSVRALAFRALPKDLAIDVFENLDSALQSELLDDLREEATRELIEELDPDDRAELLDELPAKVANQLLSGLSAAERRMTSVLLGYPSDSAGRRMSPQVATVPAGLTVGQAIERVRERADRAETIYLVPVLAPGRRLVGVVSLRRLLVSDPDTPVDDVMSDPIAVRADQDQEEAARVVRDNGIVAVPVVDAEDRVLGIYTVDDAMRVLERAETEDIARSGGTEPLRRPYLSVNILGLVRARISWLLVLVVGATLTVNVLDYFQQTLDRVVTLALFVPLLIGTGGNAGAQAATTVVRAMAVGDIRFADLARVVGREIGTGALLGSSLAAVGVIPAAWFVGVEIAAVLGLTLIAICMLATATGSITPLLARRAGVDPAVVSAPFITTFVDATGLIIYFVTARAILGV